MRDGLGSQFAHIKQIAHRPLSPRRPDRTARLQCRYSAHMKNKVAIFAGVLLVAIVSAALGIGASLMYLARPFQKSQVEFSETFLPIQVDALQALRAGHPDKAERYLEMASTLTLVAMGEQKDEGAKVPAHRQTAGAIQYLCDQPPNKASTDTHGKLTFAEACALLTRP